MKVKEKAQGMYPTPDLLAEEIVYEVFKTDRKIPNCILEPSAGFGVFILKTWDFWSEQAAITKNDLEKLVKNTIAFENDSLTFKRLQKNLNEWCENKKIKSRPSLIQDNFIINFEKYNHSFKDGMVTLGNPPWDEFTTRKHDKLDSKEVKKIRDEREKEKEIYGKLGFSNLYQAFMYALLKINISGHRISMVLPRQILGDQKSKLLREIMLNNGLLTTTVYRNGDENEYFFEAVDDNFEIAVLNFKFSNSRGTYLRRGFASKYQSVLICKEDMSIPCPVFQDSLELMNKLLQNESLGNWMEDKIQITRGKITPGDNNYSKSENGKTISAYQVKSEIKDSVLVMNKILPNSKRKMKAALVSKKTKISDSLVQIICKNEEHYPYFFLMLNSKPLEFALRSLTTNINLNNFRIKTLPIPQPNEKTIRLASDLFKKCMSGKIPWDSASESLSTEVLKLNRTDAERIGGMFPDRQVA